MQCKFKNNLKDIPGKTLKQLKIESDKIEREIKKDKKIFEKYFKKHISTIRY